MFDAVEGGDRGGGLFIAAHFDESEALAAPGGAIGDHFGALDLAMGGEQRFQIRAGGRVAEVANVNFATHDGLSS